MSKPMRVVVALLAAGLSCLLAALLLPGSASAANPDVEISVAGGPFVSNSARPLLDVSALAPGESTAAVVGVRSGMRSSAALYLRMRDVGDDDNGCVRPERAVDTTCGAGGGDLGHSLVFTIATAADQGGPFTPRWAGSARGLEHTLDTGLRVAPAATQWVQMTAALPASAGAQVESDTFRFGLTVVLRGTAGAGGAGIGGQHTHKPHSSGGSGLAATGVAVTLLAGAGALLLAVGLLVLIAAWRRNRSHSGGSDGGKHRGE